MRLAKPDVTGTLRRLGTIYPLGKRDLTVLADEWFRSLRDLTAEQEESGASAYIDSEGRFFPTPGTIRRLALGSAAGTMRPEGARGAYLAWAHGTDDESPPMGDGAPCPICGASLVCLACGHSSVVCRGTDRGRLGVRHDARRHAEAGVGYSGVRG